MTKTLDLFSDIDYNKKVKGGLAMKKETLIILILIALIILWFTETMGMRRTTRILSGAVDIGFNLLR